MKNQKKLAIFLRAFIVLAVVALVSPVQAVKNSKLVVKADLPLPQLIAYASGDIDIFWQQNFNSFRRRYTQPRMFHYYQPFMTPCGNALMNNAFYCSASNGIYYDYNFISRTYSNVGDFAAVSILAHEWGHLVQAQLGILRGRYFSIQLELQADCFAGAYTKYAEATNKLEEGDLEEAGVGLFNSGDQRGTPWFNPQAHGKPMQRINAFLTGYNGGVGACFSR